MLIKTFCFCSNWLLLLAIRFFEWKFGRKSILGIWKLKFLSRQLEVKLKNVIPNEWERFQRKIKSSFCSSKTEIFVKFNFLSLI